MRILLHVFWGCRLCCCWTALHHTNGGSASIIQAGAGQEDGNAWLYVAVQFNCTTTCSLLWNSFNANCRLETQWKADSLYSCCIRFSSNYPLTLLLCCIPLSDLRGAAVFGGGLLSTESWHVTQKLHTSTIHGLQRQHSLQRGGRNVDCSMSSRSAAPRLYMCCDESVLMRNDNGVSACMFLHMWFPPGGNLIMKAASHFNMHCEMNIWWETVRKSVRAVSASAPFIPLCCIPHQSCGSSTDHRSVLVLHFSLLSLFVTDLFSFTSCFSSRLLLLLSSSFLPWLFSPFLLRSLMSLPSSTFSFTSPLHFSSLPSFLLNHLLLQLLPLPPPLLLP